MQSLCASGDYLNPAAHYTSCHETTAQTAGIQNNTRLIKTCFVQIFITQKWIENVQAIFNPQIYYYTEHLFVRCSKSENDKFLFVCNCSQILSKLIYIKASEDVQP